MIWLPLFFFSTVQYFGAVGIINSLLPTTSLAYFLSRWFPFLFIRDVANLFSVRQDSQEEIELGTKTSRGVARLPLQGEVDFRQI